MTQHTAGLRRRDLYEPVADLLKLSTEQRAERLPSELHLRYQHRMGWGLNMLKNAGYIEAATGGLWRLTAKGRSLVENHPDGFGEAVARQITKESRDGGDQSDTEIEAEPTAAQQTPERSGSTQRFLS